MITPREFESLEHADGRSCAGCVRAHSRNLFKHYWLKPKDRRVRLFRDLAGMPATPDEVWYDRGKIMFTTNES